MQDDAFRRAVRKSGLHRRYISYISEMDREHEYGARRWVVMSYDPTGGEAPKRRVLTEDGDLIPELPATPTGGACPGH